MTDPVCHIPPEVAAIQQPAPVNVPGVMPPPQPNFASIVAAIANLQQVVRQLAGQLRPVVPQDNKGANNFNTKNDKPKPTRWSEDARVIENVRVYNPDDRTQFVDVEQINQLRMKDGVTGESWVWDRNRK